jgi:hypothetical protein
MVIQELRNITTIKHLKKINMSSVEWLYKLSKERELDKFDLEQAQAMHKEEIIDAATWGFLHHIPEQYYKEKFKKD